MSSTHLRVPTPDFVSMEVARYEQDRNYGPADRILARIFTHYTTNIELEYVLIKVVLLNGIYNANVYAVMAMARHICGLHIDPELSSGSPHVVDRIARLTIGEQTIRHYSFATKYCSWHRPDTYPIYDYYVEKILRLYRDQYQFAKFDLPDLRNYPEFKQIIILFRQYFDLEQFTFRQIDKFLWLYSNKQFSTVGKKAGDK